MRIGLVVLLALAAAAASAQTPAPQLPPAERPEAVIDRLPISLDAIKKELQEAPPPPSALRIGSLPTFRVTVYGRRRPLLPEFQDTLRQPWQAPIPGGIYNKELLDMMTPPQARPFGAFTNGGLVEVAGTALVSALAAQALQKGYTAARGAVRSWQEEQIRREVEAELEAFKRAQGLVAPPPDAPANPPDLPPVKPVTPVTKKK